MGETPSNPVPEFAQERARKTYQALIDAAAAAFSEDGYDGTKTPDIANRAGVSVGTFYRYFTDKKQIFLEIARRHLAATSTEILSALTPERLELSQRRKTLTQAISVLFFQVKRNAPLYRLFLEMHLRDPDAAALMRHFHQETRARLAALIRSLATSSLADPDTLAFCIQSLAIESATALLIRDEGPPAGVEAVIETIAAMVHRALFDDA
jgi:AcrR family transcriptional regulator